MAGFNYLSISPQSLNLTYNLFNNELTGNNIVNVIATYNSGGSSAQDSFNVVIDYGFIVNSDIFTSFTVEIDDLNPPTTEGDFNYRATVSGDASGMVKTLLISLGLITSEGFTSSKISSLYLSL